MQYKTVMRNDQNLIVNKRTYTGYKLSANYKVILLVLSVMENDLSFNELHLIKAITYAPKFTSGYLRTRFIWIGEHEVECNV
jgi:hypothetical protein